MFPCTFLPLHISEFTTYRTKQFCYPILRCTITASSRLRYIVLFRIRLFAIFAVPVSSEISSTKVVRSRFGGQVTGLRKANGLQRTIARTSSDERGKPVGVMAKWNHLLSFSYNKFVKAKKHVITNCSPGMLTP